MKIKRGEGLNIVPFIDIMLVLLAIVLSVSTFIAQGKVKVDVPSASNSEQMQNKDEKKLVIVVDKDGKFYVDDSSTALELEELKQKIFLVPDDTMVQFKGDKESSLESFIEVLNTLTEKGHNKDKFEILTQKQ